MTFGDDADLEVRPCFYQCGVETQRRLSMVAAVGDRSGIVEIWICGSCWSLLIQGLSDNGMLEREMRRQIEAMDHS